MREEIRALRQELDQREQASPQIQGLLEELNGELELGKSSAESDPGNLVYFHQVLPIFMFVHASSFLTPLPLSCVYEGSM